MRSSCESLSPEAQAPAKSPSRLAALSAPRATTAIVLATPISPHLSKGAAPGSGTVALYPVPRYTSVFKEAVHVSHEMYPSLVTAAGGTDGLDHLGCLGLGMAQSDPNYPECDPSPDSETFPPLPVSSAS